MKHVREQSVCSLHGPAYGDPPKAPPTEDQRLYGGGTEQDHDLGMPNAIKMLQDDNNSLHILLGQIQMIPAGQADAEDKAALQLASMFSTHSQLEDEFITPMLNKLDPSLAKESDGEHAEAKRLFRKIQALPAGLERRHVIAELKEVVNAHKATQEASVFPLLAKKLNVDELQNLGHTMSVREQALRSQAVDTTGAAETAGHRVYPQL